MDKKILKNGYVELQVKSSGMLQKHKFTLKSEKSAFGEYYLLEIEVPLVISELMRVANEMDLPVRAPTGLFFPNGKSPKDFPVKKKK